MSSLRLCVCLLVLMTATVRAHQDDRARRAAEALARVPADIDLCLFLNDASSLRTTKGGRFIEDGIRLFMPTDEQPGAWDRLVSALELDRERAFEQLFGRSVLLVMRRESDGTLAWAVRAEVTRETFDRVQRVFEPRPRSFVGNRPIFGIESGRYAMSTERSAQGQAVLLAPANATDLLGALIAPAREGARTLLEDGVFPVDTARLLASDALLYVHINDLMPERGSEQGETPVRLGMSAHITPQGVSITSTISAPDLAGPRDAPFRPWPVLWFEQVEDDAVIAIMDRTNHQLFEMLLGDPDDGRAGVLPFELPREVSALSSHRAAMLVRVGNDGGLEGAIALESDDVRAVADAVDRAMPALIGQTKRSFQGLPVNAMRTLPVPAALPLLDHDAGTLAWNYRIAGDCTEDQETGWWNVGLGPSTVSRLGRTLAMEPGAHDGNPRIDFDWISMGVIRPALFIKIARARGLDLGAHGALFARASELRWQEIRQGTDTGLAVITLELLEPEAVAGEPVRRGDEKPVRVENASTPGR